MNRILAFILIATAASAQASSCFNEKLDPGQRLAACEQAAREGNTEAQYRLGQIYKSGTSSTPADPRRAISWFDKAAEAGMAEAQYSLGMMYELGQGVVADEARAAHWYRQAAEQGNPDAQWLLGSMYEFGRGLEQDPVKAHMWYSLSAASGNPYGKNRKAAVSMMLNPQQLEQSRSLAEAWSDENWWAAPTSSE